MDAPAPAPGARPTRRARHGPCTALDIGTEYAKALVFEIQPRRGGRVTGVGRTAPGPVAHAVGHRGRHRRPWCDNCRAALDEAEDDGRRRRAQGRHRHRRRARQGLHDEPAAASASGPTRRSPTPSSNGSSRRSSAEALAEAQRTITWETGLPNVDVRLVHAAVAGAGIDGYAVTNPVGFQGRHVRDRRSSTPTPRSSIWARSRRSSSGSDLELLKVVAEPYAVARSHLRGEQVGQSGALFIDVGGGTTDVALVRRAASRARGCSRSAVAPSRSRWPTASTLRFEEAERHQGRPRPRAGGSSGPTRWPQIIGRGRRGLGGRHRARARGVRQGTASCRAASSSAAAARRLPEIRSRPRGRGFADGLPFARRPQVSMMAPSLGQRCRRCHGAARRPAGRDPMALAFQALEALGTAGAARRRPRRVLRGMRAAS